jgi:putative transposase
VRERRAQARRPALVKPELVATKPNEVWSWDITKLAGPYKWTWFQLYTILDVYSATSWAGWSHRASRPPSPSNSLLTRSTATGRRRTANPARRSGQLHDVKDREPAALPTWASCKATRGRTSPTTTLIPRRSSRRSSIRRPSPSASPTSPPPGSSATNFFEHYNHVHRHSGIALHTPADVHFGLAEAVREKRQSVLDAAYAARPDRFRQPPAAPRVPEVFWINRPDEEAPRSEHSVSHFC